MSLTSAFTLKSRGEGLPEASVLAATGRVAKAPSVDCCCELPACCRPRAPAPPAAVAPGEGDVAEAGIVAGCLAQPLTARISSAAGTIRFRFMTRSSSTPAGVALSHASESRPAQNL